MPPRMYSLYDEVSPIPNVYGPSSLTGLGSQPFSSVIPWVREAEGEGEREGGKDCLCRLSCWDPGSPLAPFYSILITLSLFRGVISLLPSLLISWDGGSPLVLTDMQCIPSTTVIGCVSVKLDRMTVGASQAVAWLAVPTQRRSDEVDLCEINYLGSSLIDFCISTGKRYWLSPRRAPLFKSRFKAGGPVL